MGKARIIESLGEGKYLIEVVFDTRNTELRIAELEERLTDLQWKLTEDYLKAGIEYKTTELKILFVEKELEFLKAIPRTQQLATFCVDYSKELRGEVGTIETHGEVGQSPFHKLLIQPGWQEKNVFDLETDGLLATTPEQFPEQWLFNTMMLPGWQKWQPMYRLGKILYINQEEDKAHVELDDAYSSAVLDGEKLAINLNSQEILNDVPIEYMNCHSDAFEVDDRVVVEFTERSWTGAKKIIGFEELPQPCPIYLQVSVNDTLVNYTSSTKYIRIAQKNPDTGVLETVSQMPVHSSDSGICGPFEGVDIGRPFYAEIYYKGSYAFGRPVYWFNYFELATESNHDFHINIAIRENPTSYYANGIKGKTLTILSDDNLPWFFPERIIDEADHYVKRVEYCRSDEGSLHDAKTVKVDTAEFGTIRALKVNFTLRAIRYRHTGWDAPEGVNYNVNVYQPCNMHGTEPRIYTELARADYYRQDLNMITFNEEMWAYCAGFIGDFNDGVWDLNPAAYAKVWPETSSSPQSMWDVWTSGGQEWIMSGSWFFTYGDILNGDIHTNPFIIADEHGRVISEPVNGIYRFASVMKYSSGYCIDWDSYGDCIEYAIACDREGGNVDLDRHLHHFEVVDFPQELV